MAEAGERRGREVVIGRSGRAPLRVRSGLGMTDDERILKQAADWAGTGLGVALATVVSTWGSAPRPAGSHLVVNERGELVGSVSGGCVESAVVQEALETIRDGRVRLLDFGITHERAWEVGLACGGTIQVFVERVG